VIAFVKYEGINFVVGLHFIIDCEPFKIRRVYEGTCFEHVVFKAYNYATNDDKIFVGWNM
jgi:hypothetical protein